MRKKLVFMHIPKTGGTSLHDILVNEFRPEEVCPERFNGLEKYSQEELARYSYFSGHFDSETIKYINSDKDIITLFREPKTRILSLYYYWKSYKNSHIEKHNLGGPRIAKNNNLLNFLKYKDKEIQQGIDNSLTRTLIGHKHAGPNEKYLITENEAIEIAKEFIDNLTVYGILEDFDKSLALILSTLGISLPDTIPHSRDSENIVYGYLEPITKEEITPEIDLELSRLVSTDQIIYDYAKSKFYEIINKNTL